MKNYKAHLALLGTQLFFAINFSSIKFLTGEGFTGPSGLNLVRVIFAVGLFWLLFLFRPHKIAIKRKHAWRFILSALAGIAVNQMLFVKGLSMTHSIHASLLMLTTPIMITFFAAWILKERLSGYKIAGLVLGISGAVWLIAGGRNTGNADDVLWGDLLVIINAISYSFYFILVKPLMAEYDGIQVLRTVFTIGLFFMLPFCWKEFREINWHNFSLVAYANLFLVVFCGTFLAYLFNIYGLRILGASIAGAYIYFQPLLASLIAMIFMGESLHIYKLIAAMMIFAGVYLVNRQTQKQL